jgi:cellobiose phosphorylase
MTSSGWVAAWIARIRAYFHVAEHAPAVSDEAAPLRAELFTADQMEQHGKALAHGHGVVYTGKRNRLLARLDDNEHALLAACDLVTSAVKAESRITPAAEWLLDNLYLIQEQIGTARQHLPRGYSRELPRLGRGPSAGLPRVYDLALEVIAHGDGRVDPETLERFIAAYQTVDPLTLGELWAIPIMLRLALIENLRRVAVRIGAARVQLAQAQDWASRMIEVAERDPTSLILVIADMARSSPPMASPFVAELARRLQGQGPALALPLTWIEQRLGESSLTIEALVHAEAQQQAADQVSISNSIGSLRFLDAMDWRDFVEAMSGVEQMLRRDPAGTYAAMDFATRDHYRHVVDELAKHCPLTEIEIATAAIQLAQDASDRGGVEDHRAHIGYYLIDGGLRLLQQEARVRLPMIARLRRALVEHPRTLYLGGMLLLMSGLAGALVLYAHAAGLRSWALAVTTALALVVASQLASALSNWAATLLVGPSRLPRMDYTDGIAADARTLVVIPTLIQSADNVDELLEALEVRFLGNRDAHLHFALLTDHRDAPTPTLATDAALLQRARSGIESLNRKYPGTTDNFLLLHRPRLWNAAERAWMGAERKRGKLADLNAALRGQRLERFALIVGDLAGLGTIRYVITLDTDTQLPRDAARMMVGAMAHPLNQPRIDDQRRCVSAGYGILQPRMAPSLVGSQRSRYAQLCSSEAGIDPYTRAVSDVYQDLFGEGSFIGKGIYDVDAFERTLAARLPDNRILSHDLLEGCYARAGLLSDVQLYEDHPTRYAADVSRQERWIRGDWQIAHWLLPWVPGADGKRVGNPLSPLSRGKILDNLRRSLVPAALLALLLLGWVALPGAGWWTLAVLGVLWLPPLLTGLVAALNKADDLPLGAHLADVLRGARHSYAQVGLRIACLPFEAWYTLEAIARTCWRMLVTRQRLLEWRVSQAHAVVRSDESGLAAHYAAMWIAPATALATLTALLLLPGALASAAPILLAWLIAPAIVYWLDRPLLRPPTQLGNEQQSFLRRIARRTWAYFDRFASVDDHWLAPDNYQQQPGPVLAHRTSPTNIGLALLANLSARDFGYISGASLLQRCAATLGTMALLERHQGHFYNWYDTRTLQPLPPRYISSVDSGNLAGHLLTLRAGLLETAEQPVIPPRLFAGLADTLDVLLEAAPEAEPTRVSALSAALDAGAAAAPQRLGDWLQHLDAIVAAARALADAVVGTSDSDARYWATALLRQCVELRADVDWLAPWLAMSAAPHGQGLYAAALDLPARQALHGDFGAIPTLQQLVACAATMRPAIDARFKLAMSPREQDWLVELAERVAVGGERAAQRIAFSCALAEQAGDFAAMEFAFLYDTERHLLAVGYNVDAWRRDTSYYDLLASEARLGNFVAIAQGQLPQESWFALGRLLTSTGGAPVLLSWSGSMFEYLMPQLVMPSYAGTLLDQTCRAAVARQIAWGKQNGLPWGVSESGYHTFDASLNYQYHAFGVPGLGLKRGLAKDSVVAPYASALALMVAPVEACANLQRLARDGLVGRFGFFEAIDYTASRLVRGQTCAIVRSFMAHHQGMSLLALDAVLHDQPMQRRFEADREVQATLLLLQERMPRATTRHRRQNLHAEGNVISDAASASAQAPMGAFTPTPEVQLLSNGRYHVMLTNAGGGSSRWKDLAITRWREDTTCDPWGSFLYLRDLASGQYWSATHQPTGKRADRYEAVFSEGRAEYRRSDHEIECYSEIVVSPEDDIELRRLHLTNRSATTRSIELSSYTEVVLASAAADQMHPAFSNLFVQTEVVAARRAILCTRRPRSHGEPTPWMFHLLASNGTQVSQISFETDRMRFIGRGRSVAAPRAMLESGALSGTAGSVLDPIAAIRCWVTLAPGQVMIFDWITGAAASREACMALVDKYQDRHFAGRVFDIAGTHAGVTLRQLNASEADAQTYRQLAGAVLYAGAALRADAGVLAQNRRGQSGLWGYAISGDLPIVLLKIADSANLNLARQLVQCHSYWRLKGLAVDLVIWNEDHIGYRQRLQDQIVALIATGTAANSIDRPGGIYVRCAEQISSEDRILLETVARAVLADVRGTLVEQIARMAVSQPRMKRLAHARRTHSERTHSGHAAPVQLPAQELQLDNGIGGFSADACEYVIRTRQGRMPPLPWVNVLANPDFGTVVAESGLGYTFAENAHEFRLTPWSDDPIGASTGEAIYLRDDDSGHCWSPTPLPCPDAHAYTCRHGFGYSVFEHVADGIHSELTVYVDLSESVKFSVLKVRNSCGRRRRLSATGYVEWVLGDLRSRTAMHVVTAIDRASGVLVARNGYNTEFAGRVGFFDVDDLGRTVTGDRTEFLGRNGSAAAPDALRRVRLSGRLGSALDPCGAIQVPFELADGQTREVIFRLGAGKDIDAARDLAMRLRKPGSAAQALERVRQYWRHTLGAVSIETPDRALNLIANGWLVYQTLASRVWARSGYFQSGGAFGFRDQLQDVMALVHAEPKLVREHLLRSAARQYVEGDAQHWWHPPSGRGVRTRCSDDYLWLPLAICRYVQVSGDLSVLDENVPFLAGRALAADEESYYDLLARSDESASLYQHGVRAILHGLRFGARGLPLMGSGDWNDGMNQVGIHGKGESVWLGFFLHAVLADFARLADISGDAAFADRCREEAQTLRANLAQHAWDGAWYRRAWFDDGTPLGSAHNAECSIDSISQSWSVLSGGGEPKRSRMAMEVVDRRLVRRDAGLVQLLDPPFDTSELDPGYIKGYVPGVRENGGQYTHAAVWTAMAFAQLGDSRRAWELLAMINPVNHARNAAEAAVYKAEPYVVAADVYAVAPHVGRGGWSWYTGSAGWLYRLIIESLLGLRREGDSLRMAPCLPAEWTTYTMTYRFGRSDYRIVVTQTWSDDGATDKRVSHNGVEQLDGVIALIDDGLRHEVAVAIERLRQADALVTNLS